jgi:hypothetical protein
MALVSMVAAKPRPDRPLGYAELWGEKMTVEGETPQATDY